MISDIRKIWYYAIGIALLTVATAYLIGMVSIGTEWQMSACLTLAAMLAIVPPLMLALPEPFGMVAVIGFLNGMIPGGLRPGESVEVALKKVFHALAYVALANSFMLLFFGTWDFGPYPGAAKIILVAAMVLTCWASVHKEGEWFKKISLYYPAAVIAVCIAATLIPGIVPGKAERALNRVNQALVEAQNKAAEKQIDEIMGRIKILEEENDPRNVHLIEDDLKKVEWMERNLTRKGSIKGFFTDPQNQPPSSWVIAIAIIFALFWILKKYPKITNILGTLLLFAIIVFATAIAYREWDSVRQGAWKAQGFLNKATSRDVEFSRVENVTVKAPGRGYFVLTVHPDQLTYWGTCTNDRKLHGIAISNAETREMHAKGTNLNRGNIAIKSGNGPSSKDQDLIYIEDENKPLSAYLDFPGEKQLDCRIDRPLKATLYFTPKDV